MAAVSAYLLAACLGLLWFWWTAFPVRLRDTPVLSAPQVAMLRHPGRKAAVTAAVTELYAASAVTVNDQRAITRAEATPPDGLSELARATHQVLLEPRSLGSLSGRPPVRAALRHTREELARAGLAPDPSRWRWSRLALLGIVAMVLIGVSRSATLPPQLMLLPVGVVAAVAVAVFLPRRTIAGARLLRRLRQEHAPRTESHDEPGEGVDTASEPLANALTGRVPPGLEPALNRNSPLP